MAQLITKIEIPRSTFTIDYKTQLYFTGSCFAENIGLRFKQLKFISCVNPFGVQYNPQSVSKSLQQLIEKESFSSDDLHFENELWFSFSHYTLYSDVDQHKCLHKINASFNCAKKFISEGDIFIITLGTSWAYILKQTGEIVSNCHKLPATRFERVFTGTDQSYEQLKSAIEKIRTINPSSKFIFTVSPIRHWKDGAIENQRSKAALLLAIARLVIEVRDVYYFPAYEIMMDELRDYRFYANDMLHPSELATEYIWERFLHTYLSEETIKLATEIQQLLNSLEHRPIHTETNSYKKFISSQLAKIETISKKHPLIDLNKEYLEFQNRKN